MDQLRVRLFGEVRAEKAGGRAVSIPHRKDQALIAYLAMNTDRQHSRDKLAALLWGRNDEASARHSLRQALATLRKCAFPEGAVVTSRNTVLVRGAMLDVDVAAFERLLAEGTLESLEQAAELFTGEFLEGLTISEEPFEEWLQAERQRLAKGLQGVYHALIAKFKASDRLERAIHCYMQLMTQDNFNEELLRDAMVLLVKLGRAAEALQLFDVFAKRLRRELDVEPEFSSKEIYLQILEGRSAKPDHSNVDFLNHGLVEAFRSLDGFVVWDDEDRFVLCNDKFREIFSPSIELLRPGVSWHEIIRTSAKRGRFPDAIGNVDSWVAARLDRRLANAREARALAINDGRVYRMTHRRTEAGGMVVIFAAAKEQRQQEIDLFRAEARYEALVRAFPHGIEEVDIHGKILSSNRIQHRMLGYEPGELVGRHLRTIMLSPWIKIARGDDGRELGGPRKTACTYISKLGTKISALVSWSDLRDETGRVASFVAVVIEAKNAGMAGSAESTFRRRTQKRVDPPTSSGRERSPDVV